jgi:CRP-like cAMP-binding protein
MRPSGVCSIDHLALNALLSSLDGESSRVLPRSGRVRFEPGEEAYSPGSRLTHLYFPVSGAVCLLLEMEEGIAAEAAFVGAEGVAGFPALFAPDETHWRATALLPTEVVEVQVDAFLEALGRAPSLRAAVERYSAVLFRLSVQFAGCSRFHTLPERLARLLLLLDDRSYGPFRATHEMLAQILGSHRPTVTLACKALRDEGLIDYRRAEISVIDRTRLERAACECYSQIRGSLADFERSCRVLATT